MKLYTHILTLIVLGLVVSCSQQSNDLQSPDTGTVLSDADHEVASFGAGGVSSQDGGPGPDVTLPDVNGKIKLPVDPPRSPQDWHVITNCLLLQTAAERFAAMYDGKYPWSAYASYPGHPDGWALVDLFPGGTRLENPYTGELTEPGYLNAYSQGSTGYIGYHLYDPETESYTYGYFINGWGENGEIFRILKNVPEYITNFDSLVTANSHLVQEAAENFAAFNDGVYAGNLADVDLAGNTLIDYLPDGQLLLNPYTGALTEPVGAPAATPGQTGYVVIVDHTGTNSGYTITGFGRAELILCIYRP